MAVTFDGTNLRIILPSGALQSIDVQVDLYSAWKSWLKVNDNAKYPPAFDTAAGDPITETENVAPFFFLRNDLGWRIRGPEESAEITFVGNLFGRSSLLPIVVHPEGAYTHQIKFLVSSRAIVAGSGDPSTVADAVAARAYEGTLTLEGMQRVMLAMLSGLVNGAGTGTENFRDLANTKNRAVVTVDAQGNRSNVVLDPS